MSFDTVLYEAADGIARITMNRPEKHNALNHQMMDDLDAAFAKAGADDDVAAIVLAGAGPSFCAGYDLKNGSYYITPPNGDPKWKVQTAMSTLADIEQRYLRIFNCPKTTIAQVQAMRWPPAVICSFCAISRSAPTARAWATRRPASGRRPCRSGNSPCR